ncbi:LysE/ArgO family amino acid transporter [Shimia sp. SDUM112013]|uniref:LysE/ArgO family amino acid transporter n=1 Tax=Shimia sp. SDUM112013 TaxID=3136160 RepID=UPI0032EF131F
MLNALAAGFFLGLSLIMAIGAQNAFVLRQGLRGQYVLPLVLTCAISDALLITAGVMGFGVLVESYPSAVDWARWGGAAFLVFYGAMSFRAAWTGGAALEDTGRGAASLWAALGTCLVLTWANPHVYLDTVVLLGGISSQYMPAWGFGLGAVLASFTFFFSLGYGARLLRPYFTSPRAWQVLDVVVGLTMWGIALKLLLG